jgi:hypothetical protein
VHASPDTHVVPPSPSGTHGAKRASVVGPASVALVPDVPLFGDVEHPVKDTNTTPAILIENIPRIAARMPSCG